MPEAFACLFILIIALVSFIAAKFMASNPANRSPHADHARLRQHRAWLEERLQQAWRENWDHSMRARIADEINDVEAQLATMAPALKPAA